MFGRNYQNMKWPGRVISKNKQTFKHFLSGRIKEVEIGIPPCFPYKKLEKMKKNQNKTNKQTNKTKKQNKTKAEEIQ